MTISSVKTGAVGLSLALDNNYMEPIATTLVGSGGTNNITFNDIPQTYKHLQIRYISRNAAVADATVVRFNSDAGTNYALHSLRGNGSTAFTSSGANTTFFELPFTAYSGTTSNVFGGGILDILDYAKTNKNKTARALGGADLDGSGSLHYNSGLWINTAAINSITIFGSGSNISQYSRFSLYGIKG